LAEKRPRLAGRFSAAVTGGSDAHLIYQRIGFQSVFSPILHPETVVGEKRVAGMVSTQEELVDHVNRFETKTTYRLLRVEYGIGLIVCVALFFWHIRDIRWIPAVALFVYIDIVGYLPGLIAHLRAKGGEIPRVYYVLYNTMHSMTTQSLVVGAWMLLYRAEWALLVLPIHLCGDRALFGNFMKSFLVPFEPKVIPDFENFEQSLRRRAVVVRHVPVLPDHARV
jgi:hypothetical protein